MTFLKKHDSVLSGKVDKSEDASLFVLIRFSQIKEPERSLNRRRPPDSAPRWIQSQTDRSLERRNPKPLERNPNSAKRSPCKEEGTRLGSMPPLTASGACAGCASSHGNSWILLSLILANMSLDCGFPKFIVFIIRVQVLVFLLQYGSLHGFRRVWQK